MSRVDFSQKTKQLVAARAGYRCSIPGCCKVTIGPGTRADEVATTGVAAHIFSASPGGPRGGGGLTPDEISDSTNAIWVCSDHSRLIDANRGTRFPPPLLLSYKHLQEARISREQGGLSSPVGWIHTLRVKRSPLLKDDVSLVFGRLNLIVGDNYTGKSALCEWLAGLANIENLWRWRASNSSGYPIEIELTFFNPDQHTLAMSIGHNRCVAYQLDGRSLPVNPLPIQFIAPLRRRDVKAAKGDEIDDLDCISSLLRLDPAIVRNLAKELDDFGEGTVRNLQWSDKDGRVCLKADVEGTIPGLRYASLSESERDRLTIELAIAQSRHLGEHAPTMLILDACFSSLDRRWFEKYSGILSSPRHPFQTLVVIPTRKWDVSSLRWLGWEVIRFSGDIPRVSIDQSIRE